MATTSVPATLPAASLTLGTTTVFLVRHADVPPGADPHLNAAGLTRANELIRVVGAAAIAAVYASEFARTRETAQPLATHLGLTVKVPNGGDPAATVQDIRAHHLGKTVLVVGHSNTVPDIISRFGAPSVPVIEPTVFDRLFVLTLTRLRKATIQLPLLAVTVPERGIATLLPLRYGAPT